MITGMMLAMVVILGYELFVSWLWKKNNWKTETSEPPAAPTSAGFASPSSLTMGHTAISTAYRPIARNCGLPASRS